MAEGSAVEERVPEPGAAEASSPERRADWVPVALPGLLALAGGLGLAIADGGILPSTWYPAALAYLALLAIVGALAPPPREERSRLFELGLGLYLAFVAWSFASLLWADSQGAAWEGSNRALLFGIVIALLGLRPWRRPALLAAVAVTGVGAALIATVVLLVLAGSDDPSEHFLEGRLGLPIDYANANASLWLIGFFCAIGVATARSAPWALRALGLGGATVLLQTALLSQSRGAAIGVTVTAIALVALSPRRWPTLAALAVPAALTVLGFDTLTAVRNATSVEQLAAELDDALAVILRSALVATVLGAVAALAGGRAPSALSEPRVRRAGDLAIAALAVAGVVAALVAIGNPATWIDDRWEDFKSSGYSQVEEGGNRFGGSLGSNRYDFWRVALDAFRDHPVAGLGADNYASEYLLERRSAEAPRHPHSFAFRLISQHGVVGTLLFLGFLAAALGGVARSIRGTDRETGALTVAALCGFLVWFVHGLADWLWAFPALSVLALGLLAVAARARGADETVLSAPAPFPSRETRIALMVAAVLVAFTFAAPGISARYTKAAYQDFREAPGRTLARLDRAAEFDPFSAEPLLARGVIGRRLGRIAVARESLLEAIGREPTNWFGHFELALLEGAEGDREAALDAAREARRLNPRQPLTIELVDALDADEEIRPADFEARLYGQLAARLRPTEGE